MSRPRVFDSFPFGGSPTELLLLECRLTELYDAVDAFIIVEAKVDHQDHPKALNYRDNEDRFAPWKDKIKYVVADSSRSLSDVQGDYRHAFREMQQWPALRAQIENDFADRLSESERREARLAMPTSEEDDGVWAREHAQRDFIARGLAELEADPDDILMQSDADEIPRAVIARNVRPQRDSFVGMHQKGHFWAIDWEYPPGWNGTVACRVETALKTGFGAMRDKRNFAMKLPNAGWHFSWLGGPEAWDYKVNTFCHPEVVDRIQGSNGERRWREGVHVDHIKMTPVDVDHTWPKWMQDPANVPKSWYRPR